MKNLGLEIEKYCSKEDPTKVEGLDSYAKALDWSIHKDEIESTKNLYDIYCKNYKKRKVEIEELKEKHKQKVICLKQPKHEILEDLKPDIKLDISQDEKSENVKLEPENI